MMQNFIQTIKHKTFIAWFILSLGIFSSFLISYDVWQSARNDAIKHFSFATEQLTQKINERLQTYALILQGGSALFMASDEVTRKDWHNYINALHVNTILQDTLGIGYNIFIPNETLQTHIQTVQKEGFTDYHLHPLGIREYYSPVIYIEPFSGENLKVLGFDTSSEARRRVAMEQTRDTGKPTLTEKITLIQDTNASNPFGMIMFQAVYDATLPLESIEQRRMAIKGWISLPFLMNHLVQEILDNWQFNLNQTVSLKIYDTSIHSKQTLLYDNSVKMDSKTALYQEHSLPFYEHTYLIAFDVPKGLLTTGYLQSISSLILGILLSFLLFSLLISVIRTNQNAKKIARNLTKKIEKNELLLKQNEALLQNLIHAMPDLVWFKDKEGVYLTCNSRFEGFFGERKELIIGKTDYDFVDKKTADEFRKNDLLAMHNNITYHNEEWITFASDEHQELLDTSKTPIYDEQNTLLGVLGIGHDITRRKKNEEELRKLSIALEQSPASVVITDLDANVEYVNPRFTEITGYSPSEIMHQNPRILQSGENKKEIYCDMWNHLTNGKIWKGELHNKRKNGELYWEEARISPIKDETGKITHYVAIKIDITQRKSYEKQVKELLEEQKAILNSHIVGIAELKDRKFTWVNDAFANMHGYMPEELLGKSTQLLYPDEASFIAFGTYTYPLLEKGETVQTQIQLKHKDGTLKWYSIGGGNLYSHCSNETIWSFVDITEQKKVEEENIHLAFYDALTLLPNRRLLDERLTQALLKSTRSKLYGALLFLDLDNFKPINDTHGHYVGDLLLVEVAKRLQRYTRDSDTVARFGGDEFVIILNDLHVDYDTAKSLTKTITEKVLHSLTLPYDLYVSKNTHETLKITHSCTASIVVVLFQNHKESQENILKWADNAMYQAKEQGKRKIVFSKLL